MRTPHPGLPRWAASMATAMVIAAAVAGVAVGQDQGGSSTPQKTNKVADLTNRYRLAERYTREGPRDQPGVVGVYRVGMVEVVKEVIDSPNGAAPRRSESTRQTIYRERAAEVTPLGVVTASVRAIEEFRLTPDDPKRTMAPKPFDGLKFLERPRGGEPPLILSQVDGRNLTEFEYELASRQVYLPHLSAILPSRPCLVGDSWKVPMRGTQALLGEVEQSDTLMVRFRELRREADGPRMVAVLTIGGKATLAAGETSVNAEAMFTFTTPAPAPRPPGSNIRPPSRPDDAPIEGRGAITEFRLGRTTSGPLPGPGRLKYQVSREVTIHRQLGVDEQSLPLPRADAPGGPEALPRVPTASDPRAWLTLIEPSARFVLRHPQDFLPPERSLFEPPTPGSAVLVRKGTDMLQLEYAPRTLAIADLKAKLADKYALMKLEVIKGDEGWLPEVEWPRMKVYHVEAAVQVPERAQGGAPANATRIHFDGYLIQFGQAASVMAIATTSRGAVAPFRREVEQVLRTIELDPAISR